MPDIRNAAVRYIDTADKFALVNIHQADYIRHIVSNCAAERMKRVKPYQGEDLSQYRAGGPVWREYLHDAGMAGKTKATVEGSPVKTREIKRLANNAISEAGIQSVTGKKFWWSYSRSLFPSGRDFHVYTPSFGRLYVLMNCSIRNVFTLSSLRFCAISRLISWINHSSGSGMVYPLLTGMRRSTPHYGAGGFYPLGSIPRCCNSLRSTRLIQVANEVSPSALAASSSCALNSSGSRIWYCGDRFSDGVDMVITRNYYRDMVITSVLAITKKTTPRSAGIRAGRLTKSRSGVTIMAVRQHTPHSVHIQTAHEPLVGYQPGGRVLADLSRRGYFSTKASSANCVWLVSGGGLSRNLRSWSAFSRCRSIMDNAISCSSSLVIVYLCKATRRSTLRYSAGGSYPSFREGYVNIFRTNFSRNTSDHLSPKAVYTDSIPYKTGIGRRNPFNCEATNDARSVFFSASDLRHINGVVHCAYPCTIQSFHELHFAQRHQQTMVMLAGLPKGRPESLQSGIPTPASVTALCERRNSSGDVIYHCKEAATMATTPDLVHSQTAFIWRFITVGTSESQIIHVTAWTEREARNHCPSGCVAVFAAKIRQGASHG
ncbi:host cell division inhibitor Icd-like protein [Escherichia coli O128]|nr:host cell division inhibitor Icd-like protein [Escherichia coli O128]